MKSKLHNIKKDKQIHVIVQECSVVLWLFRLEPVLQHHFTLKIYMQLHNSKEDV